VKSQPTIATAHARPFVRLLLSPKVWMPAFVIAGVLAFGFRWATSREPIDRPEPGGAAADAAPVDSGERSDLPHPQVEVVRPRVGEMGSSTTQPAWVEAFHYANLFAKVSGYLATQKVDIGSAVKVGQPLATIDAPEVVQAADQASAELEQAQAQLKLNISAVDTAKADVTAARANVVEQEADLKRAAAFFDFHKIKYSRIRDLYKQKSIDERAVDEERQERDSAEAAFNVAEAAIRTAQADLGAKQALEQQAQANLADSKAKVQVASAVLAKAKVYVSYLTITSPYNGVVTNRNYHIGDFIRASEEGGQKPLLTVAETDLMRIVVKMPEEYVPLTQPHNPAVFKLDFTDHVYRGTIARIANSLDRTDKTMRTEIDIPNPHNELRDGMYGYATIDLSKSLKGLSIPSRCLLNNGDSTFSVFVVHDGRLRRTKVKVASDSGSHAEISSGLQPDDRVVLHPSDGLQDGQTVKAVDVTDGNANPSAAKK
jgi:HlyD family secretion protein